MVVGCRLLPSAALCGDRLSAAAWDALLSSGILPGGRVQPPVVCPQEAQYILYQVALATGRDMPTIRADCEKVASIVRDAMSEARTRQSAQTVTRVSV